MDEGTPSNPHGLGHDIQKNDSPLIKIRPPPRTRNCLGCTCQQELPWHLGLLPRTSSCRQYLRMRKTWHMLDLWHTWHQRGRHQSRKRTCHWHKRSDLDTHHQSNPLRSETRNCLGCTCQQGLPWHLGLLPHTSSCTQYLRMHKTWHMLDLWHTWHLRGRHRSQKRTCHWHKHSDLDTHHQSNPLLSKTRNCLGCTCQQELPWHWGLLPHTSSCRQYLHMRKTSHMLDLWHTWHQLGRHRSQKRTCHWH